MRNFPSYKSNGPDVKCSIQKSNLAKQANKYSAKWLLQLIKTVAKLTMFKRTLITLFIVLTFHSHANINTNDQSANTNPHLNYPTFTWEEACAISVCRGTGHDGVFSALFSPNGKTLLADVRNLNEKGLYLVDTNGKSRFLTQGQPVAWHPNGKQVVYLFESKLWLIDINTKKKKQLTDESSNIASPKLSPDGKSIAFVNQHDDYKDIWVMPLEKSQAKIQVTTKAMTSDEVRFDFSWSPNSQFISYFSNKANYWYDELWLVNLDTLKHRKVTDHIMAQSAPSWSPDGNKIAIYGTKQSDFWYTQLSDIFIVDLQTNTTKKLDKQITANEEAGTIRWSEDGKHLYFVNHSRGELELWSINAEGGVATRMTHKGGFIHTWDMSASADKFAIVRSTPTRGREIELLSAKGGKPAQLTQFSTAWQGLIEPEEISYQAEDGTFIQAFVFYPPNFSAGKTYPAIVQVHGGGTHSYYNGLNLVEQRLAQLGYVVMAVNYRGGSGFGRGFQDLAVNDWANTQALDAASAADFIRSQPWSNKKVGIFGYSYGGIISMAAVTRAPKAFDAAVPMAGIYDFAAAYKNENRLIKLFIKHGHSGKPEEKSAHYEISNSVSKIQAVETPILLMHGESDTIAPFEQFELAKAALYKHDKVFEAYSFAEEPHRFNSIENRVELYQKMEDWMNRYLK